MDARLPDPVGLSDRAREGFAMNLLSGGAAAAACCLCATTALSAFLVDSGSTRTALNWNLDVDGSSGFLDISSYNPTGSLPQTHTESHVYQSPGSLMGTLRSDTYATTTYRTDGMNGSQGHDFEYDVTGQTGSIGTNARTNAIFTLTTTMAYSASITLTSPDSPGNVLRVMDSSGTMTLIDLNTLATTSETGTLGPGTYVFTAFTNTGASLNSGSSAINAFNKSSEWDITFTEIPAPGTLTLIAASGFVATRRRR